MSILSVPLTPKHEKMINKLIKDGVAPNKAELTRIAIEKLAEERAVQDVLEAMNEPNLEGDMDKLVKKFK